MAPREVGALQISAAFKDSEVVDANLRDFAAEHLDAGAKPRATAAGEFVGFEIAFSDDERYWRQWYLRNGRQMLLVTYNCALECRGVDDDPIGSALPPWWRRVRMSPNNSMQRTVRCAARR